MKAGAQYSGVKMCADIQDFEFRAGPQDPRAKIIIPKGPIGRNRPPVTYMGPGPREVLKRP